MPSAQVRNSSMQQLNSADLLDVEDRNFGAEWYDSVGGTTFLGSTVVPLGTTRHNAAPEIFDLDSNIVTILEAGLYLFLFSATASQSGSAEMIIAMSLDEDPDTGSFSVVPGTLTYMTFFNGSGTLYNSAVVRVGLNYRYRLAVSRVGGAVTPTLLQNGSKLAIIRLFKNG